MKCVLIAFRALLQIRALEPLPPDVSLDDDTATGNPKVSVHSDC